MSSLDPDTPSFILALYNIQIGKNVLLFEFYADWGDVGLKELCVKTITILNSDAHWGVECLFFSYIPWFLGTSLIQILT